MTSWNASSPTLQHRKRSLRILLMVFIMFNNLHQVRRWLRSQLPRRTSWPWTCPHRRRQAPAYRDWLCSCNSFMLKDALLLEYRRLATSTSLAPIIAGTMFLVIMPLHKEQMEYSCGSLVKYHRFLTAHPSARRTSRLWALATTTSSPRSTQRIGDAWLSLEEPHTQDDLFVKVKPTGRISLTFFIAKLQAGRSFSAGTPTHMLARSSPMQLDLLLRLLRTKLDNCFTTGCLHTSYFCRPRCSHTFRRTTCHLLQPQQWVCHSDWLHCTADWE